ncbi:MAG: twin-arginine translocation signal domain-containing protein, partial [Acidobacteria bacterium]|nr:twin-arginine translocation signal domain-containing protein [Acidobacteriota bacterium]
MKQEKPMQDGTTRRQFVGGALTTAAAAGAAAAQPADQLPKGEIGKLRVSRLLLGGNLLTRYTHSRDLKYVYSLARAYNTDEKLLQT